MHGTGTYTEAQVRRIGSLMQEWGHQRIDLLKLSVEGSEYEILGNILAERIPVGVLCVEFCPAEPARTDPPAGEGAEGPATSSSTSGFAPSTGGSAFSSSSID